MQCNPIQSNPSGAEIGTDSHSISESIAIDCVESGTKTSKKAFGIRFRIFDWISVFILIASTGYVLSNSSTDRDEISTLILKQDQISLGDVDQGVKVPIAFQLINSGNDRIKIKDVFLPCDCMTMKSLSGMVIQARRSMHVKAQISSIGKRGEYNATIHIFYNIERDNGKIVLISREMNVPIQMRIKPKIIVKPDRLSIDENRWSDLTLIGSGETVFSIKDIEVSDPFILCEPIGSVLNNKIKEARFRLKFDSNRSPAPSIRKNREYWIRFVTDREESPAIKLSILLTQ